MSLSPIVLQSQPSYAVDAIQESNRAYYFIPTGDVSGGSTSSLVSPVTVTTADASGNINNGITVNADNTQTIDYGYYVQDANAENLVALVSNGDTAILQLGYLPSNTYITQTQTETVIGNTTENVITSMISWNPTDPNLTLKLHNPTVITGPSGDGVPYDTIYNPLPAPTNPPVPIITSPTSPVNIASWNADLTVASTNSYTVPATGLYLVTSRVTVGVGVSYSFPAGSILNLTPRVQGTDDPYNSMTYFLSSTAPQGNIGSTQSGLGFYVQGAIISGHLNQASTGAINLGSGGSADMFIQQVINQYP